MKWPRLEELREKMQVEQEFSDIFSFFFDHLGENEQFIEAGSLAPDEVHEELMPVLEKILGHIAQRDVLIADLLLTTVPGYKFYHGPCMTDAGFGCVIYFQDLRMGMVSLSPGLGTSMVHYARFTTLAVAGKHHFIVPPKKRESSH